MLIDIERAEFTDLDLAVRRAGWSAVAISGEVKYQKGINTQPYSLLAAAAKEIRETYS